MIESIANNFEEYFNPTRWIIRPRKVRGNLESQFYILYYEHMRDFDPKPWVVQLFQSFGWILISMLMQGEHTESIIRVEVLELFAPLVAALTSSKNPAGVHRTYQYVARWCFKFSPHPLLSPCKISKLYLMTRQLTVCPKSPSLHQASLP